jgi:predicted Zn-dependent protease
MLAALLLTGCVTNPVTGEQEMGLVSEASELRVGQQQYPVGRQMQGGDYRLDPALSRYVNKVGQRLAAVSDRRLPYEFVVLNNSTPNAWAIPGGKIAINRGLLVELKSEAELAAVLAHEIVHTAARHGAKSMERGMLLQGAVLAAGVASRNSDYSNLAMGAASLAANLVNQKYSRGAELEADHYGMLYMARAGYDPHAAVTLQETFLRLSKERRRNWLIGMFASHPPSQERVNKNREFARELGVSDGETGTARYRRAIAGLIRSKPAYAAYDKGKKALSKGDLKSASALAAQAIQSEPREALFYSLQGDIATKRKSYSRALTSYNRAVKRDDRFFYHYLRRGETRLQLNNHRGARSDLQKSIDYLPTAVAYYSLGRLELEEGNRSRAKAYFSKAASSRSKIGTQAAAALARLELSENPGRYLKSGLRLDRSGRVFVHIKNVSPLPVTDVRFTIGRRTVGGGLRQASSQSVRGVIGSGQTVRVGTRIGGLTSSTQLRLYGLRIDRARVR